MGSEEVTSGYTDLYGEDGFSSRPGPRSRAEAKTDGKEERCVPRTPSLTVSVSRSGMRGMEGRGILLMNL